MSAYDYTPQLEFFLGLRLTKFMIRVDKDGFFFLPDGDDGLCIGESSSSCEITIDKSTLLPDMPLCNRWLKVDFRSLSASSITSLGSKGGYRFRVLITSAKSPSNIAFLTFLIIATAMKLTRSDSDDPNRLEGFWSLKIASQIT